MSVYYFWIGSGEGGRREGEKERRGREPSQEGEGGGALAALDLQNRDNTTLDDERTDAARRPPSGASGVRQASNRQSEMKTDRIQ